MNVATFKEIDRATRDQMVANFIETVGNLEALTCSDFNELARACEVIGKRIREEMPEGRGLLMFAKIIVDQANRDAA